MNGTARRLALLTAAVIGVGAASVLRLSAQGQETFDVASVKPAASVPGETPSCRQQRADAALQEQLGRGVEDSRAPVESLIIEGVERPTANCGLSPES